MKKPLLDVVFASAKRKDTLLLLQEGQKEMESLLKLLDTTRQALLPQVKILEEHHLVFHHNDTYELTTIGKLIVDEMAPLISTTEVLDIDIEYWGTHNLDFIPTSLLMRLNELHSCKVINPSIMELYDINQEFFETSNKSKSLTLFFTFLYPNFPEIYTQWINNVEHINLIVNQELFERIKLNYRNEFKNYIDTEIFDFYLYNEKVNFVSFGYNDYCAFFRLLLETGEYDNKQLMCCSHTATLWVRELCEYYMKNSTIITEI